jgi:hypothetical protein
MARYDFTGMSFLWRFAGALLLVGATYNPEGISYYHWAVERPSVFGPAHAVSGVLLLSGWVIALRATRRSLGLVGLALVLAFCASLVWLVTSWGWLSPDNPRVMGYVSLGIVALVLAVGMSWSHLQRRLSGQYDVEEIHEP